MKLRRKNHQYEFKKLTKWSRILIIKLNKTLLTNDDPESFLIESQMWRKICSIGAERRKTFSLKNYAAEKFSRGFQIIHKIFFLF